MSSVAVSERPAASLVKGGPVVTDEQLDLIKRTVAKDASTDELRLYLYDCARQGVHPLDKLIHFTKRAGKYTPVTSIDFMRIRAAETGEMAGSDRAQFEGTKFGNDFVARVTVYRLTQGQRFAYEGEARWTEYKPDQDFMWRKMPHTMLAKCAEAVALRKGFPRQLAGLYAKEELDQADNQAPAPLIQETVRTAPSVDADPPADPVTGEVADAPPPGFYYVVDYVFNDPWHEANLLGYDSQGGSAKVSTKTRTGLKLEEAQRTRTPIAVEVTPKRGTTGQYYVNKITLLGTASESF